MEKINFTIPPHILEQTKKFTSDLRTELSLLGGREVFESSQEDKFMRALVGKSHDSLCESINELENNDNLLKKSSELWTDLVLKTKQNIESLKTQLQQAELDLETIKNKPKETLTDKLAEYLSKRINTLNGDIRSWTKKERYSSDICKKTDFIG